MIVSTEILNQRISFFFFTSHILTKKQFFSILSSLAKTFSILPIHNSTHIMANTSSAKKAMRQNAKRTARNNTFKRAYKEAVKSAEKAILAGEKNIEEKITVAQKALDKAAKRGVIKANKAARKLSRLMKKVNSAK